MKRGRLYCRAQHLCRRSHRASVAGQNTCPAEPSKSLGQGLLTDHISGVRLGQLLLKQLIWLTSRGVASAHRLRNFLLEQAAAAAVTVPQPRNCLDPVYTYAP